LTYSDDLAYKFSKNTYICEYWLYKTMPDATDDRISELEIMISLTDIGGSPCSSGSAGAEGWSGRWAWMALLAFRLCVGIFFFGYILV
jgi:hypothetical protein